MLDTSGRLMCTKIRGITRASLLDHMRAMSLSLLVLSVVSGGCAGGELEAEVETEGETGEALSTNDVARRKWARYIKDEIGPVLVDLGVDPRLVRRVAWFGLSEGIFTIGTNPEYGQPGGRQSPLGVSNCGDNIRINRRTAFPDCFGVEGYAFRSGNWQVGIGGAQVSDSLALLPRVFHALYGDASPESIAQPILDSLGEDRVFPDLSVEALSTRANARWASVLLRDPAVNVYVQTYNTWITDGRNLGYGASIIAQVWATN